MVRKNRSYLLLLLLFSLLLTGTSWAAVELTDTGAEYRFGKVKSSPRPLKWKILKTRNFDILFYEGLEELALRCRDILEVEAFERVYPDFQSFYAMKPYKKIRVILFTSRKEYQNSQATGLPLTTSSEGVANILTNRLVVIRQPTLNELRGVLVHEVTHLITLGSFRGSLLSSLGGTVPGWMAEGLAEYYQPDDTRFALREVALRDVVLRDAIPSMRRLEQIGGNLDYALAYSLVDYIAREYGKDKLALLVEAFFTKSNQDHVFRSALGIAAHEFEKKWRTELEERYIGQVRGVADDPRVEEDQGVEERAPSITEDFAPLIVGYGEQRDPKPDGDGGVFFLSTYQSKFFDLYHWKEGIVRRLTEETVIAYDRSPDGEEIVFISDQDGERQLYLLKVRSGEVTPFPSEISNPVDLAWSPLGDCLAVVINTRGDTDIFLIDLQGRVIAQIANGYMDEHSPAWSQDGDRLVYVSRELGHDQLYLWEGNTKKRLTSSTMEHREPVWGIDGYIYFTYGEKGYYQTASLCPESGQIRYASRFWETLLAPAITEDGMILSEVYTEESFKIYRWRAKEGVRKDE